MSMRTVSDPVAREAVSHLRGVLSGGLVDTLHQVMRDGETLCRPDLWEGPRAAEFRHTWPGVRKGLQTAHDELAELARRVDAITLAIMHAGGA